MSCGRTLFEQALNFTLLSGGQAESEKSQFMLRKYGLLSGVVHLPVIPVLGKWRQEDSKFKAILGCILKFYLKVRNRD